MKKHTLLNVFVLAAMVLSLFVSARSVEAKKDTPNNNGKYMPGEVVVVFKSGKSMSQYAAMASSLGNKFGAKPVKVGTGGLALMKGDSKKDAKEIAALLSSDPNVLYAEPNYIYELPDEKATVDTNYLQRKFAVRAAPSLDGSTSKLQAVPIDFLQSLRSIKGSKTLATYPNDPYLWWNSGWDVVDADIVAGNTTTSAVVCVLDTGVDYLHPDLSAVTIKGYDFVNGDADPMDDFGHGTHVAGIIAATANNAKGMAGASNAKVVAVKVLGAQGWGTNYDIAQGINYCANRTDVKVLNMSLGGGYSESIDDAINYAVNTKGKLVVAAAGNANTDEPSYPAYLATYPEYANKVLAVAASGSIESSTDGDYTYYYTDYYCRASYSNYGSWVSVVAPGTDIYSTLPYDKPFYLNYFDSMYPRYDYMSGTSMATPFVAAAAARRWGYKPLETNSQIGLDVIESGWEIGADDSCWPLSMEGIHQVNIANLMDRFAVQASVADASTGFGLNGAQISAYYGTTLKGTAIITPYTMDYNTQFISGLLKQTDIFSYYTAYTEIINLPTPANGDDFADPGNGYVYKANKSGYTASPQPVFMHDQWWYNVAELYLNDTAGIPPKSSNIEVVMGFTQNWDYYNFADQTKNTDFDLDLNVWLPSVPNALDASQIAPFIVGWEGEAFGYVEGDPTGSMNLFPFARYKREGGAIDYVPIENTTISSRKAHAPLAANAALPYYPGAYVVGVTDFGATFDHDANTGTAAIPTMGAFAVPYVYIWKDGYIKLFNMMDYETANGYCNKHWWKAATISSGISGVTTYTPNYSCSNGENIFPY